MKYFLMLLCMHFISSTRAQDKQIKQIDAEYKPVSAWTDSSEKDTDDEMDEPYYCNQLLVNTGNKPGRAVCIYGKTVKFWYTDNPDQNTEENAGKDGVGVLKKMTETTNSTYT